MTIAQWSTTAATNASGVTGINWAEGQPPSSVNDSARETMAQVATWLGQASGAIPEYLTGVAGTNTITATGPSQMAAYVAGQRFTFIPAVTNTGATTINITPSGGAALGAKNVFVSGQACVGGELVAAVPATILYDGTQFNILGKVKRQTRQIYTTTGANTWSKPTGLSHIEVEILSGGGSGGRGATDSGSGGGTGGTAGSGAYGKKLILEASLGATETATVGAGAAGATVSGAAGSAGGTSSFGTHISATGGAAGGSSADGTTGSNGNGGTCSSGDVNGTGAPGITGVGGSSLLGGGGNGFGGAGTGKGAGGAGSGQFSNGGAGSDGIIIVTEFYA